MCSINGITWKDLNVVKAMCRANKSRGPDGTDFYISEGVTLGHNLLAINSDDIEASIQPKVSSKGTILAFNGEIYDVDQEEELDTDYLHRNLDFYGMKFLRGLNGAFALAYVKGDILYLARDHFGTRPMFWAKHEKGIIFSSTIFGIIESKEIVPDLSNKNIEYFQRKIFSQNGRMTVYSNIHKLAPGEIMRYNLRTKTIEGYESVWEDWEIEPIDYNHFTYRSLVIDSVLRTARTKRKLGLLHSGGLDSNLIAAILGIGDTENFFSATLTYTHNPEMDDSPHRALMDEVNYASIVTQEYNIPHKIVTFRGTQDLVDEYSRRCIEISGSIFEDSYRAIPRLYLLEQMSKMGAKVVLSGDGGDEIFSGYNKHRMWIDPEDLTHRPQKHTVQQEIEDNGYDKWFPLHVIANAHPITAKMFIELLTSAETYLLRLDAYAGAFGMENRVPFLYQDLVKYAMCIPLGKKLSYRSEEFRGINKYLIREVFKDVLPEEIVTRKQKLGWTLPYWRRRIEQQRNRMRMDTNLLHTIVNEAKGEA